MEVEELTAPLQFFVEVSTYVGFGNPPPADSDIVYKKRRGETIAGVSRHNCRKDMEGRGRMGQCGPHSEV